MVSKEQQGNPAPYMNPLLAGVLLGLVLLATFVITGHGLGATGFTTRLTAWIGMYVAPAATNANDYLGGMVEDGKPLSSWITWQVIGVALGALASAFFARRIQFKMDGAKFLGGSKRPWTALFGGVLAGFGARIAAGGWFVMSELVGNKSTKLYDGSLYLWTLEGRPLVGVPLN